MLHVRGFPGGRWKANAYLIAADTGDSLLVDPGDGAYDIVDRVRSNGLVVQAILCTHGHYDHTEAGAYVQRQLHVPFLMHSLDTRLLRSASLYRRLFEDKSPVDTPTVDLFLDENASPFHFGSIRVEVLHTPGHTPGSVCFMIDGGLFTGDTLLPRSVGRTDLPGGDRDALRTSLVRLGRLPRGLAVFPGHGGETTLDSALVANSELAHTAGGPHRSSRLGGLR